ncbi:hypothetical protein QQS21_011930 [Conoideocrella luteorostrata]|uniref:Uncharacterized protein n=1 Tax=Conoideocrella luteorostrata TaxID=1105319 RepID=A0AAJ0CC58_9HYPO|nr:hypothetical protein QQS21_011930 [Conoideocrella luteorostrata]
MVLGAGACAALTHDISHLSPRACTPDIILDSITEDGIHQANSAISFKVACGALDTTKSHAIFISRSEDPTPWAIFVHNTTITAQGITMPDGLGVGQKSITIVATDLKGLPLLKNFVIAFGSAPVAFISKPSQKAATTASSTYCHADVLSQPQCQNPPPTCDFYESCAEAALLCGPGGYPLGYGLKNCQKFMQRLQYFTSAGRTWIFKVMTCLQHFLITPLSQCDMSCNRIKDIAFSSHPQCYVESGVCDLPLSDWVQLVITVNTDLLAGPALKQAVVTGGKCALHYVQLIENEIKVLEGHLGNKDIAAIKGQIALFATVKSLFETH